MTKKLCKVCAIEQPVKTNVYGKGGTERWLSLDNRRWSGKTCPDCFAKKMRKRYIKKDKESSKVESDNV